MSEPTFEQLHPGAASTITTGVDIAGVVGIDMALQAMLDGGLSGGSGADAVASLPPPTKLASFSVYWDASAMALKMHAPKVVYGSKQVEVADPGALSNDSSYYCVVKTSGSGSASESGTASETVTAEIATKMPEAAEDGSTTIACVVPICSIDSEGKVTQYHVGAVVASKAGSGAEYIAGDDTNIVFTPETDDSGSETGKIKVDVYYK